MIERNLTEKQIEILKLVVKGNSDGSFIDLDQLLERLSYKPSKAALQFSLRFMAERGLLEKKALENRRGSARRIYSCTAKGYNEYKGLKW